MKAMLLAALLLAFQVGVSQPAEARGNVVMPPVGASEVIFAAGTYKLALDDFEAVLQHKGGFRATLRAVQQLQKQIEAFIVANGRMRNKSQLVAPFNLVNIWHKNVMIHFYREASGKALDDVKAELLELSAAVESLRLTVVEVYGLHVVL